MFRAFVRALFSGKLTVRELPTYHTETTHYATRTIVHNYRDPVSWVKPSDAANFEEHMRRERAREEREAADRLRHQQNYEALLERQRQLTHVIVARANVATGLASWAGDPPRDAYDPRPHERYAGGVPVFVDHHQPRLWAVVCPVASRVEEWARWKWQSVLIVAASPAERDRLSRALHGRAKVIAVDPADPK